MNKLRNPNDKKFNGMSDNRNNRTSSFKLDTEKADLDKDGKLSSYEKNWGHGYTKSNEKSIMAYGTKTKKKPKEKTVIMIAVGKMKPKKNGRKTKSSRKKKKVS